MTQQTFDVAANPAAPRLKPVAIVEGKKLSLRLAETLGAIALYQKIYNRPPTQREISKILNLSQTCICDRIAALVRAKVIENEYYCARQMRVTCNYKIGFILVCDDMTESFTFEDVQNAEFSRMLESNYINVFHHQKDV